MALVQQLPNGHLVVLLTPREAMMLSDQILEPSDFPWQGSEAQVTAFEVKQRIRTVLESHLMGEVNVISQEVVAALENERVRRAEMLKAEMFAVPVQEPPSPVPWAPPREDDDDDEDRDDDDDEDDE